MSEPDMPMLIAGDAVDANGNGAPVLVGAKCRDCGQTVFPPVTICSSCMSEDIERVHLPAQGTLYSWSVVHVAPRGWTVPYIAGYVDLMEGVRVFTHIVDADPDKLEMDMQVALCTATLGTDTDGTPVASYAFVPTGKGGSDA